jgi:hypothetical protein
MAIQDSLNNKEAEAPAAFAPVKKAEKRRSDGINGKGDFMRVLAAPSGRQFRRRKNEQTCVFIR